MSSYLAQPDYTTAINRSIQQGIAMGVSDNSPWWTVSQFTNPSGSQYFIIFEDMPRDSLGMDFTKNPVAYIGPNAGQSTGLTASELLSVMTQSQMIAAGYNI